MNERKCDDKWLQGYVCAITILIKLEGCVTANIKELIKAGGVSIDLCRKAGCSQEDIHILKEYYE